MPEFERYIVWNTPAFAINAVNQAQLAEKDQQGVSPNNAEVFT